MYTSMHAFPALYSPYVTGCSYAHDVVSPFALGLLFALIPLFLMVAVWVILIKGYALWTAAKSGQKWWFVALLVINTLGILELIYLAWYSPKGSNKLNPVSSPTPAANSSPQA